MTLELPANRNNGNVELVGLFDEALAQDLPGGLAGVFRA
jgi:hypothetical protein